MTTLKSALPAAAGLLLLSNALLLTQRNTAQAQGPDTGLSALAARLSADEAAIAALRARTAPLSLSGRDLTITGVNVHIVSGSGTTSDGTADRNGFPTHRGRLTGLGNLIIGYDGRGYYADVTGRVRGNRRAGSHNLILGDANDYTSYGGLVAGAGNAISGQYAAVSGGFDNTAGGYLASVSGGIGNTASGLAASVSGGDSNRASGDDSSVSGGQANTVSGGGFASSVSGGAGNTSGNDNASVSGGAGNTASGESASVSGGQGRRVSRDYGWAAGRPAPARAKSRHLKSPR